MPITAAAFPLSGWRHLLDCVVVAASGSAYSWRITFLMGARLNFEVLAYHCLHILVGLVVEHGNNHHFPKNSCIDIGIAEIVGGSPGKGNVLQISIFFH